MEEALDILNLEYDSIQRIVSVVNKYPLALYNCANILELLAPLTLILSGSGAENWLRNKIQEEFDLTDIL